MAWRRELKWAKGWNFRMFSYLWVPDHHIEQGLARDGATLREEPRTRPIGPGIDFFVKGAKFL
jgi:hypothetical protein